MEKKSTTKKSLNDEEDRHDDLAIGFPIGYSVTGLRHGAVQPNFSPGLDPRWE